MEQSLLDKLWFKNDDGKYECHGDCQSWNVGICTCGLWHHLKIDPSTAYDLIGWDNVKHRRQFDAIHHLIFNRLPVVTECSHGVHLNDRCQECKDEFEASVDKFFNE